MKRLSTQDRVKILSCLTEGMSLRSTSRICEVSRNTVEKLLADIGPVCVAYQDRVMRDLTIKRLQIDEQWSWVGAKAKNVPEEQRDQIGVGDTWLWVAIDADSRLVPYWVVGGREYGCAETLMYALANRIKPGPIQISTDAYSVYPLAIDRAFGDNADFAMIHKVFRSSREGEARYSPADCTGVRTVVVSGDPDPQHISTSYVERLNLTNRMCMRRFTRLTNGFSKSMLAHCNAISLHYMTYNFCKIHKSLRVTPAMEAGIADHPWTMEEVVGLLENVEPKSKRVWSHKRALENAASSD